MKSNVTTVALNRRAELVANQLTGPEVGLLRSLQEHGGALRVSAAKMEREAYWEEVVEPAYEKLEVRGFVEACPVGHHRMVDINLTDAGILIADWIVRNWKHDPKVRLAHVVDDHNDGNERSITMTHTDVDVGKIYGAAIIKPEGAPPSGRLLSVTKFNEPIDAGEYERMRGDELRRFHEQNAINYILPEGLYGKNDEVRTVRKEVPARSSKPKPEGLFARLRRKVRWN